MAVIETPPETVAAVAEASGATRAEPTGFAAVLGSGDHKVIGRLYIACSLAFAVAALAIGTVIGVERLSPDGLDIFGEDNVLQFFSLYRLGLVFLVALPLVIGVALVVVPLQVGSRAVAFPRAAAASFWGWLLGAALFIASYAMNGGPGGGRASGVNLWITSLGLMIVAILLAAVCLATTVLVLRQTGMSTDTVPMFSWSIFAASVLWILTLPIALAFLALAYIDHRHAGTAIGANADLFGRMGWRLRTPQIYVRAIPVLGFAADVAATTAKARIAPRAAATGAVIAFAIFSFGAFVANSGPQDHKAWVLVALGVVAVLPVLAILGLVGDLFRRGKVGVNGGLLYAVAALLVLLLTTVAGAIAAIPATETWGSTTDLAVNHGATIAALIAGLGGIHWWATKIGRQPAVEAIGRLAPLLLLGGGALVVAGDVISALVGEDGTLEVAPSWAGGVEGINLIVVIGFALTLLGVLAAISTLVPLTKRSPNGAPADPWEGQTLEWLAPSPPPSDNFVVELPVVTSAEPLLDLAEEK